MELSVRDINFFLHFGYFPDYEQKVTLDFDRVDFGVHDGADYNDLKRMGREALQGTVDEMFETGREHVVPLSGGLDSRAILAALIECTDVKDIKTYTFGTPGTYDYDLGCHVAKVIGTDHTGIALDRFDWGRDEFYRAAGRFDYQTFLCHHAPISVLETFKDGVVWSGYVGDVVTGGHLKAVPSKDIKEARTRHFVKRCESSSMKITNLSDDSLIDMLSGGVLPPEHLSLDEQVFFDECGSITAPHVLLDGFDYRTPFINSAFMDFYFGVSDDCRAGQKLFIDSLCECYPAIFSLPAKTSFGAPLKAHQGIKALRRVRHKAHNVLRSRFKSINWPALPMTNFFDIDLVLRTRSDFAEIVLSELQDLMGRGCCDWIDIDDIWQRHMSRAGNHGDVIKILFSLEVNLKGREGRLS